MVRLPFFPPGKGKNPSQTLPLRPKHTGRASVVIHRLPTEDGVIIKVTPPERPDADDVGPGTDAESGAEAAVATSRKHVPCDIVLVIDVSGSMAEDAPVPTVEGEVAESNGLSVLDLVKHASRTILETLDDSDRLGIVTFSTGVEVLQQLTPMTSEHKKAANEKIESMVPLDSTNLWQGILTGISLFKDKTNSGRVPAIMILTDGMPNFMSPPQGYIPKMRTLGPIPAPIHTFGFGYTLRSGLLKSISEFTGGNYAFIPDAGMIGTVFVHAVANMQSTFASDAILRLTYPKWLKPEETVGQVLSLQDPIDIHGDSSDLRQLVISLGSLQYGQSRDVYLRYTKDAEADGRTILNVVLEYHRMTSDVFQNETRCALGGEDQTSETEDAFEILESPGLSPGESAFHISRSMLCNFLSTLFPLSAADEHVAVKFSESLGQSLAELIEKLPASAPKNANNAACAALIVDIKGQVEMALSNFTYYRRWGMHYLPSLQCAHTVQQCNSFKDAGPLLYGAHSPLFIACRDALDTAFDTLPAPKPSKPPTVHRPRAQGTHKRYRSSTASSSADMSIDMRSYRSASGPCFASFCRVTLADGRRIRVNRLRRGMRVSTPRGPRAVAAVLKTPVSAVPMVPIGRLLITAWHPVSHNGKQWVFPCHDPAARKNTSVRYTGSIYSVLLQPDQDVDSHAISIEGVWVVTLGHGLTAKKEGVDDVRAHSFFGDYAAVTRSLTSLDVQKDGLIVNGGSARSNWRQWHTRK